MNTLTNKLLIHIFSFLRYKDIKNIKLTCKTFNAITSYNNYNIEINILHFIKSKLYIGNISYKDNKISSYGKYLSLYNNIYPQKICGETKNIKLTNFKLLSINYKPENLIIYDSIYAGKLFAKNLYLKNITSEFLSISAEHISIKKSNIKKLHFNGTIYKNISNFNNTNTYNIPMLPKVVFNKIFSYLGFRDLQNCKLVCKYFKESINKNNNIYLPFIQKYFNVKTVEPQWYKLLLLIKSKKQYPAKGYLRLSIKSILKHSVIQISNCASYINFAEKLDIHKILIVNRGNIQNLCELEKLILINCSLYSSDVIICNHLVITKMNLYHIHLKAKNFIFYKVLFSDNIVIQNESKIIFKIRRCEGELIINNKKYSFRKHKYYEFSITAHNITVLSGTKPSPVSN